MKAQSQPQQPPPPPLQQQQQQQQQLPPRFELPRRTQSKKRKADAGMGALPGTPPGADDGQVAPAVAADKPPPRLSCVSCRGKQLKCDQGSPCSRCLRLGLECVPKPKHSRKPLPSQKSILRSQKSMRARALAQIAEALRAANAAEPPPPSPPGLVGVQPPAPPASAAPAPAGELRIVPPFAFAPAVARRPRGRPKAQRPPQPGPALAPLSPSQLPPGSVCWTSLTMPPSPTMPPQRPPPNVPAALSPPAAAKAPSPPPSNAFVVGPPAPLPSPPRAAPSQSHQHPYLQQVPLPHHPLLSTLLPALSHAPVDSSNMRQPPPTVPVGAHSTSQTAYAGVMW